MKKKITTEKAEKKFDAVQMMRRAREALSVRYWNNPALEQEELREVRKKFKKSKILKRPGTKTKVR